ncbi:baeRF3 domain-containing protein [Legionella spiritensis]|uniref:baeRF3 domain-containing protein n=1 Tax=Legionella spiritensis TaxID=452 RepID=UPI000F6C6125|nr:hypothetical protein [Legionella spiritensis]VEG91112.1 Uncharacterised protein [Legionella spiritensis]
MNSLIQDYPEKFIHVQDSPCVSLYQPTHRSYPDNEQDVIRYKNLLKQIETSLLEKYSARECKSLLRPFHSLADDREFWIHTDHGLAILATPHQFNVYKLPLTVDELTVVADTFHIKPLIHLMQSTEHYQILSINREKIRLFEGNRDDLEEIPLHPDVHDTLTKALGEELTNPRLTVASYGKGAEGPAMYHGHGGRKDQVALDIKRFFRIVAEDIHTHHSQSSKLPLILAGLPQYHHVFHEVSHNPCLIDEGIPLHTDNFSLDELREMAWNIMKPRHEARLRQLTEKLAQARTKQQGSDKLAEIAKAAVCGRVDVLLIDADQRIPGHINASQGDIRQDDLMDPEIDDVLDDMAEIVLQHKGEVFVVPGKKMPTQTGVAALYRY